jgi:hypothetical protein
MLCGIIGNLNSAIAKLHVLHEADSSGNLL